MECEWAIGVILSASHLSRKNFNFHFGNVFYPSDIGIVNAILISGAQFNA